MRDKYWCEIKGVRDRTDPAPLEVKQLSWRRTGRGRSPIEAATYDPPPLNGCGAEVAMSDALLCSWCDRPFRVRQTGGRAQRFCQPSCRRAFHSAVRIWALDAIANGALTVAEIRSSVAATRALAPAVGFPVPVREAATNHPAPIAPRLDRCYTRQQDLEQRMAQAIAMRRRG